MIGKKKAKAKKVTVGNRVRTNRRAERRRIARLMYLANCADNAAHETRKPFLKSLRKVERALKKTGRYFPGTKAAGMGKRRWLRMMSFKHNLGGSAV